MSLENVELVRSLQPGPDMDVAGILADEEATAGWLEEVAPFFDADVQCTMRFPGMAPVTYAGGVEGLADAWRDWLRAWSSFRFDVEEVLDGGDRIVVVKLGRGKPRPGAPEKVLKRAAIWTVRDGRISRIDFNIPEGEALTATGLRAQPEPA